MTKDKIILGIDPGTNILGFGVIGINTKGPYYIDMGVFDLRKIKDPYEKLANIFAGVSELIATHEPDYLAVESPFYGKNAQVVLKLGRAQGAALTAAVMKGIPVAEYAPRKAKIAICGNGAASKEQVSKTQCFKAVYQPFQAVFSDIHRILAEVNGALIVST